MNRNAYVYGWDEEPTDERPSEFAPTTGYSALSGFHHASDLNRRAAHRQGRSGFGRLALVCAAILGVVGFVIYQYAKVIHG